MPKKQVKQAPTTKDMLAEVISRLDAIEEHIGNKQATPSTKTEVLGGPHSQPISQLQPLGLMRRRSAV